LITPNKSLNPVFALNLLYCSISDIKLFVARDKALDSNSAAVLNEFLL
jgi:hypothetical protein